MRQVKRTPPRLSGRSCRVQRSVLRLASEGCLSCVAEPALVEKIDGLVRGVFIIQPGVAVEVYRGRNTCTSGAMVLVMFIVGRSGHLHLRQQLTSTRQE